MYYMLLLTIFLFYLFHQSTSFKRLDLHVILT